jgi:hypothetical protein
MSTMVGVGPRLSGRDEDDAEPVYLLTRRRSSIPPPPAWPPTVSNTRSSVATPVTARVAVERPSVRAPFDSDISVRDEAFRGTPWDENEDDTVGDDPTHLSRAQRFTRRQRAMRVLGVLALAGVLGGGTVLLEQPKVRHEALAFVTLGHAEGAARLGRSIATFFESFRR